jgi:hypothetical protein
MDFQHAVSPLYDHFAGSRACDFKSDICQAINFDTRSDLNKESGHTFNRKKSPTGTCKQGRKLGLQSIQIAVCSELSHSIFS